MAQKCEVAGHTGQEVEREGCWSSTHVLFIQSRTPSHGMMPPTFGVSLPSSAKPWKGIHTYAMLGFSGDSNFHQVDKIGAYRIPVETLFFQTVVFSMASDLWYGAVKYPLIMTNGRNKQGGEEMQEAQPH